MAQQITKLAQHRSPFLTEISEQLLVCGFETKTTKKCYILISQQATMDLDTTQWVYIVTEEV